VTRCGREIGLSKTEFSLLEVLMRRPGQVVPRCTLIETVWGFEGDIASNPLDAFISLLRRKVDRQGLKK
jgi:two-component system response regulator MprA